MCCALACLGHTGAAGAPPEVITIGGDHAFPPYQFLEGGEATGFDVELARAVAAEIGAESRVELGTWQDALEALAAGEVDLLPGVSRSPGRRVRFDFTIPHSHLEFVPFVRAGSPVRHLEDLAGRQVLIQAGGVAAEALARRVPDARPRFVERAPQALARLAAGEAAAAILVRSQGLYLAHRAGLDHVQPLSEPLVKTEYGFAVRAGNTELRDRLNEGLERLREHGRIRELRHAWLTPLEPVPPVVLRRWIGALLLLLGAASAWGGYLLRKNRRRAAALRESEITFQALTESSPTGIFIYQDQRIAYANEQLRDMFALDSASLDHPDHLLRRIHPGDRARVSAMLEKLDDGPWCIRDRWQILVERGRPPRQVEVLGTCMKRGRSPALVASVLDVTEQQRDRAKLEHLAYYDQLTGLPNRLHLEEHAPDRLAEARREEQPLALLYLDLDRFKQVNDTRGHQLGDQLLQSIAALLHRSIRYPDLVARIGGDEFVALVAGSAPEIHALARNLLEIICEPFEIDGQPVSVGGSIGFAHFPEDGEDLETLLACAEVAMYEAKNNGSGVQSFLPELREKVWQQDRMAESLHHALLEEQIELHYQPRVELASGRLVGVEALARWQYAEHGMINTEELIRFAKNSRQIHELGRQVLRRACRFAAELRRRDQALPVAINLSSIELLRDDLVTDLASTIEASGITPRDIEIEIDSIGPLARQVQLTRSLTQLKDLGVRLRLDHFGVENHPLNVLSHLRVETINLAPAFIAELKRDDETSLRLLEATVAFARRMEIRVLAGGVEDETTHHLLLSIECHEGQGRFYGPPLDPETLLEKLKTTGPGGLAASSR